MTQEQSEHQPLDLDEQIEQAIDEFERLRRQKWDDVEAGARINTLADTIAAMLFESATSLLSPIDHAQWRTLSDAVTERFNMHNELVEALQVKVAQRFFGHPIQMAERAIELLRVSLNIRPTEQVRTFLALVARTHILGLTAECAVMCRAVLDKAVQDRFDAAGVKPPTKNIPIPSFPDRVAAAIEYGWLDDKAATAARLVWKQGSKTIHEKADFVANRLETVTLTAQVLERLYVK
jgi:hypothetical protein